MVAPEGGRMATRITRDAIESFPGCRYKGFLKLSGREGARPECELLIAEARDEAKRRAIEGILARRLASHAATAEAQVDAAFRLMLLRPPSGRERERVAAYVRRHGLANACQVLLNCNEFFFVD